MGKGTEKAEKLDLNFIILIFSKYYLEELQF
jgi:hypothetical protein